MSYAKWNKGSDYLSTKTHLARLPNYKKDLLCLKKDSLGSEDTHWKQKVDTDVIELVAMFLYHKAV